MLRILLICVLSTILKADDECLYKFQNASYSRTSVLTIKGLPTNLAYDRNTKSLFFTLIDLDTLQNDDVQTKMDQYVLKDNEPIKIDNVNGQAAAIDVKHDKVYIATDKGLTVLNETNKANFLSLKDEDIVQLFKPQHTDDLYAILYPENVVYRIDIKKNEKYVIDKIPCAYIIAVDVEDNIYFECDSKYIKVLLKGFQEPIEYVGIPKNSARALAVDDYNNVYLAANDGIYYLRPDNIIPMKVMELEFIPSGIVFDNNAIYIASNGIIYRYNQCL